ncbi:aminotransferase class IV [Ammonifex thiophilus]|uniref:aminotransferase class IV n=1 Tax=Ammonifex thiophilus TaxID=444093 RepID=UPI001402BDA2|nr:aminotransferase class IV [Ammonifex thiophilus]
MGATVFFNGSLIPLEKAKVESEDQGWLYGFGLFETVLVFRGKPVLWPEHRQRLEEGRRYFNLPLPLRWEEIEEGAREVIRINNLSEGALRLTLSAGPEPGAKPGNLLIRPRPLPYSPQDYRKGFGAGWSKVRRNEHSPLTQFKTISYLENLLAWREARKRGWEEALLLNTRGLVAEGSRSNVFLVKKGKVITPSLDQGVLPGIIRQKVIEICRELGCEAAERPVTPAELLEAEEAFLTNSLMLVMPLVKVEGRPVGTGRPGRFTEEISRALEARILPD